MNTYIFLLMLFIFPDIVFPQTDSMGEKKDTTDLRNFIQDEKLLEDLKSEDEDSKLLDNLENLKSNPYDLNTITSGQLQTIPFLNSVIAVKIIEYRKKIKSFNSKRELLRVEGMTNELYEKIKPYLIAKQSAVDVIIDEEGRVYKTARSKSISWKLRSRLSQDLQPKSGFLDSKYQGSRPRLYNRFNIEFKKENSTFAANLTAEKDAGEKNLTDFASCFLSVKDFKNIKYLIAGDYELNFAQGLAMNGSLGYSKGSEAVNALKKKDKEINSYSSVNETQFFRGAAAKVNIGHLNFDLFFSNNHYDAVIDTSSDQVTSFYYDGYHRTTTEINRKNSARENLFGGRLTFENGSMHLGATYWTSKFSKPIVPDSSKHLFKFTGTTANMVGFDYDFVYKNMNIYGEIARSQSHSIAGISSLQITFFKIADLIFSYRNYSKDFAPVHSFGFGERNGDTYNERGFYSGISVKLLKGLVVNSYFDQYEFPYRTFLNPLPASGKDFLINFEWNAVKDLDFILRYKNESKEEARTIIDEAKRTVKKIDEKNQLSLRTGFSYRVGSRFRLTSRFEYVFTDYRNFGGDNKGIMFYSDIRIIPVKGLVFNTRFVFFDTDNYDSRIYEFENDIKGILSDVALSGKGRRWYALITYKPFQFFEFSVKYSETYIDGAKSIGSGNDRIKGDINNWLSVGIEAGF